MKKRCTNSKCRRLFVAGPICPYCGKEYPRILSINHQVHLINMGKNKILTVMTIRDKNKESSLLDIRKMVENCPCVIGTGLSRKDAIMLCEELKRVGAHAIME